ncbi:serine/threonine protein kinase [Vallitalea okinawensis]|uniref:serine/threonine protein kinase n=1 Tax=Vallitalea okinawensis TaxID=2078660 RepID=UPI00130042C1|nr:serine/threonine protein kinase [Vallitalea okinawensis]
MSKQIFGINTRDLIRIGGGKEGAIYMTPDRKVLKVYLYPQRCISEYKILREMEGNKYFPNVFECKGRFMLREYVEGIHFRDYIKENGLSKKLAMTLIDFAEEFDKIGYVDFDGLNKHVLILNDNEIKVIDPVKKRKTKLYVYLIRDLNKLGVLNDFIDILRKKRPDLALKWIKNNKPKI